MYSHDSRTYVPASCYLGNWSKTQVGTGHVPQQLTVVVALVLKSLVNPSRNLCKWLVVLRGKYAATNQKHYPDLGSDTSSVWNFFACSSDVISRGNQWWRSGLFSQANVFFSDYSVGFYYLHPFKDTQF